MEIMSALGNYFLSVWLWSVSWGVYQAPLSTACMVCIVIVLLRMRFLPALFLSIVANVFSWIMYTLLVLGILCIAMNFQYVPDATHTYISERALLICLSLAAFYSLLQTLFFAIVHMWYRLNLPRIIMIACLANAAAGLTVYVCMPLYY